MNNRQHLSVFGAPCQIPNHGSITTSSTMIGEDGSLEAKSLLADLVLQQLESSYDEQSFLQAVDNLAPRGVSQRAMTAVSALSEFGDSLTTVEDLLTRYAHLRHIESGNTSSATRAMHACLQTVLRDQYDILRRTLVAVFDTSPGKVREAVVEVRKRLLEFSGLDASLTHLPKLRGLLRTLQELVHFESEINSETHCRVQAGLLQETRAEAEKALDEVVLRKVCELSEEHKVLLETSLKDLEAKSQEYRQRRADIVDHFNGRQKEAAREEVDRMSTACLSLSGPSKDQVLTGVKSALSCSDLAQVASKLTTEFQARVREYGRRSCPHIVAESASMPTLILEVGTADLARLMDDTVQDNLGNGHSSYQLIEAYGLDRAVKFLYGRAAPTCSFSGRACETLGIAPDELSIVRLPKARTLEDERIRTRLEKRLEKLPKCKVTEGEEAEREILLTRVQGGWPIGIEDANSALQMAYLLSGERDHIPHLLGFLPDSPIGRIIPALNQSSNHPNIQKGNSNGQ